MNAQTPIPSGDKPVRRRAISRKVHAALAYRVHDALPWDDCARAAGLSPAGLYKARRKPEVQQRLEEIKAEYIQEVESLKAPHKARALEVARELLEASKSDAVKARMVEFLAGEAKGNSVNVAVQVNNGAPASDYAFVRPGQQVVEIRPAEPKDVTPRD